MQHNKYYEKLRKKQDSEFAKYNNFVNEIAYQKHIIHTEDTSNNAFARAQYKRNLDELRRQ